MPRTVFLGPQVLKKDMGILQTKYTKLRDDFQFNLKVLCSRVSGRVIVSS